MASERRKKAAPTLEEESEAGEVGMQMRSMFRIMMEEQMRAEAQRAEAKRVAEAEKEEEAKEVRRVEEERREKAAEVAAQRMFDQQVALLRIQAELGEKAARVHREEQAVVRRRDRAIASVPNYKEGEDVEEFLLTAEKRLGVGGIREDDWVVILASKLSGKLGTVWQDICATVEEYREVKNRVLKACGYTPKLAAEVFFGFKSEQSKGLTADQLYHRGVQLFRRMVAPHRIGEEAEFTILRGWISSVVPRKARIALDARVVNNAVELVDALQDYLILEGERTEGQAAVFKRCQGSEAGRDRVTPLTCFKCGRAGHKAADCWGGENSFGSGQPAVGSSFGSNPGKITCFSCGEEGHKSTQCPNRNKYGKTEPSVMKQVKAEPKEVPIKPLRRIRRSKNHDTVLKMRVNGQEAPVLLDSGSSITVVPEVMVAQAQRTGERVAIKAFGAKEHVLLPMAEIPFEIGSMKWVEPVALSPVEEGSEEGSEQEVVYGLNLLSKRGMELIFLANKDNPVNQRRLTEWVEAKDVSQGERKDAVGVAAESDELSSE